MTLQHLRSSTANKRPDPTAMADGQIALNTAAASPGLFYKDSAGNLVKAGPVHVGSTAPNVSPASGGTAGNSTGEAWLDTSGSNPLLKIWGGAAWQTVQPVASGTVVSTADTGSVTSTMIANGTIVDADVNASAAIAGTKISPNFGSQNVTTTGTSTAASFIPSSSTVPTNGVYLPAANSVALSTNGTGRLFVDSSGQVGVGVQSPLFGPLHVREGTNANVIFATEATEAAIQAFNDAGSSETPFRLRASEIKLYTSSTERLRITSAGLVGVGTSTPGGLFHVGPSGAGVIVDNTYSELAPPSSGNDSYIFRSSNDGSLNFSSRPGGGGRSYRFWRGSNVSMIIDDSGRVGIGTSSPSELFQCQGNARFDKGGNRWITIDAGTNATYDSRIDASHTLIFRSYTAAGGTPPSMVFDTSGRLGIGTSSPGTILSLKAPTDAYVTLEPGTADGNCGLLFNNSAGTQKGVVFYDTDDNYMSFSTNNTERFRCDSSGRLLVGTSTQQGDHYLQVQGSATSSSYPGSIFLRRGLANASIGSGNQLGVIDFGNQDGGKGATISAEGDAQWGTNDYPGRLVFSVTQDGSASPTERLRIGNAGEITTFSSGAAALYVTSSKTAGTTDHLLRGYHSATSITSAATLSFNVYTNGNVQNTNNSYTAISDIKLKENIVDANSQWDDIKALQVRNYNLKEGQTHKQIGLIAQEVEPISPGLVYESPDRDAEGNDLGTVTKSVNYSVLYMKAVKALQEAMERIEQLEQRLTDAGIA